MSQQPAPGTTLNQLLSHHAETRPEQVFVHFPNNGQWRYRQALEAAEKAAAGFSKLGVVAGDRVLCLLANGDAFLRSWFGTNYLGAIHTPCNTAWRGTMLENALAVSGAKIAVVDAELLPRLVDIDHKSLQTIIAIGDTDVEIPGITILGEGILTESSPIAEAAQLSPGDAMQIIFTSGTTGPSKGVLCSYEHLAAFLLECLPENFGEDQNYLVVAPLFHAGGLSGVYSQLICGGSITLPSRFKSDTFWPMVRKYGVSSTTLLGVMTPFLLAAEESADDKDHPLKTASIAPLNDAAFAFAQRFSVKLWTSYGATEFGAVISCSGSKDRRNALGFLNEGYQAMLLDAEGKPAETGAVGELCLRTNRKNAFFTLYYGNPQATENAYRAGWYCTGDMMRQAENGLYYFADRKKDCIRRRGENISSLEVENEVQAYPGVSEVAAYAVPSELSEDEVMIALSYSGGVEDFPEILGFLVEKMPHYMVPRYFRLMPELPKTETGKIKKEQLRAEGITPGSWDREAAGIRLHGERLGKT